MTTSLLSLLVVLAVVALVTHHFRRRRTGPSIPTRDPHGFWRNAERVPIVELTFIATGRSVRAATFLNILSRAMLSISPDSRIRPSLWPVEFKISALDADRGVFQWVVSDVGGCVTSSSMVVLDLDHATNTGEVVTEDAHADTKQLAEPKTDARLVTSHFELYRRILEPVPQPADCTLVVASEASGLVVRATIAWSNLRIAEAYRTFADLAALNDIKLVLPKCPQGSAWNFRLEFSTSTGVAIIDFADREVCQRNLGDNGVVLRWSPTASYRSRIHIANGAKYPTSNIAG